MPQFSSSVTKGTEIDWICDELIVPLLAPVLSVSRPLSVHAGPHPVITPLSILRAIGPTGLVLRPHPRDLYLEDAAFTIPLSLGTLRLSVPFGPRCLYSGLLIPGLAQCIEELNNPPAHSEDLKSAKPQALSAHPQGLSNPTRP